jgi:hypothetical protein
VSALPLRGRPLAGERYGVLQPLISSRPNCPCLKCLVAILPIALGFGTVLYFLVRTSGGRHRVALVPLLLAWVGAVALLQVDAPSTQTGRWLLASLASTWIPFVATGMMYGALEDDPWSPLQRMAAAGAVGLVTIPITWIVGLLASCMLELGCI